MKFKIIYDNTQNINNLKNHNIITKIIDYILSKKYNTLIEIKYIEKNNEIILEDLNHFFLTKSKKLLKYELYNKNIKIISNIKLSFFNKNCKIIQIKIILNDNKIYKLSLKFYKCDNKKELTFLINDIFNEIIKNNNYKINNKYCDMIIKTN